jgi:hypothetical protein
VKKFQHSSNNISCERASKEKKRYVIATRMRLYSKKLKLICSSGAALLTARKFTMGWHHQQP